jgi:hypothetical protein
VFPGVAKHEEWFKEPGEYMWVLHILLTMNDILNPTHTG